MLFRISKTFLNNKKTVLNFSIGDYIYLFNYQFCCFYSWLFDQSVPCFLINSCHISLISLLGRLRSLVSNIWADSFSFLIILFCFFFFFSVYYFNFIPKTLITSLSQSYKKHPLNSHQKHSSLYAKKTRIFLLES